MPPQAAGAPRRGAGAGRRAARRPGRRDVRQPHRVPRGLPRLRLARRGRRCRSTPRRWGRRSSTSSPNSEAQLLVIEAAFLERLQTADLARTALREIWVVGDAGAVQRRGARACARCRIPRRARPIAAGRGAAGRSARHPLHLRHHRAGQGRDLPACAVLLVGREQRATCSACGADDVLCTTLPLFHINALNTFAQAAITGCEWCSSRASRLRASGRRCGPRARRWSTCSARWCRSCWRSPRAPASATTACASGSAPACRRRRAQAFLERTGVRLLEGYGSTETNFAIATAPDSPRGGVMGWLRPGFEARVADEDDVELPDGEAGELLLRADEPYRLRERLLQHAREDGRGLAQPVVPHRRPRGARGRRRLPLRRPHQGRDPAARREHLFLRGRAGAAEPSRRGRLRGLSGALRAGRGRGDGRAGRARRGSASTRPSCSRSAKRGCRTSRCRATSTCWPTCRAPRTARCRSTSCASAA